MSSTPSPDRAVQLEFYPFPDVGELNDAICRSGVPEATGGMPRLHPVHMQGWPPRVDTLADVAIAELAAGMEILILGGTAIVGVVLALTAKLSPRPRRDAGENRTSHSRRIERGTMALVQAFAAAAPG